MYVAILPDRIDDEKQGIDLNHQCIQFESKIQFRKSVSPAGVNNIFWRIALLVDEFKILEF